MRRFYLLFLLMLTGAANAAESIRLLFAFGANYADPQHTVLQFAESDAARVRDVFVELGGIENSRAMYLKSATAQKVRDAFAQITGRIAELKNLGHRVTLIVYGSAHGQSGALLLSGERFEISELRDLANKTQSDVRVTIVDACDSGVRNKGATLAKPFQVNLEPHPLEGEVFISSSGAHESAQEWSTLSGSLFTHYWLSALRGVADANDDRRVTLME